jgi:S-DNA-T family DNA segregation ATPase FtsK/SpoIIIE
MAVAMGGMVIGQMAAGSGDRKRRLGGDRRDYMRYLAQQRKRIRRSVAQQREASAWRHPEPGTLWSVAMTTRRWERRPTHPDFLEVRVGTGRQRLATKIAPMSTKPIEDLEPLSAKSLRRFIEAYTTLADQPVSVYLPGFSQIRITGEDGRRRALARALLGQVAAFHAPEEVVVALCLADGAVGAWEWAKWLPHVQHPVDQDAAGSTRLAAESIEAVERMLGDEFLARPRFETGATASRDEPFVLIICDGGRIPAGARMTAGGYRNAVLIDLGEAPTSTPRGLLWADLVDGEIELVRHDQVGREIRTPLAHADGMSIGGARAVARILSPYRLGLAAEPGAEALSSDFDLATLLGVSDLSRLHLAAAWAPRSATQRLRIPIGIDAEGAPVEIDIKESALGGMGPHGMLVGATGSGKSERCARSCSGWR